VAVVVVEQRKKEEELWEWSNVAEWKEPWSRHGQGKSGETKGATKRAEGIDEVERGSSC
jgi:hypothetical protein